MTPTYTPFQHSVQVTINDTIIDYLLTVDETGHVYEAKPAVFELPAMAQKLILSDADEMLEKKIHAFARLIPYILPLTLAGWLKRYQEEFATVVQEINRHLDEKGKKWESLYGHTIPDSIASNVLEAFSAKGEQRLLWQHIVVIIQEPKEKIPSSYMQSISSGFPAIAADFFPAVIPFLSLGAKQIAYEALGKVKSEAIKTYLLAALNMPDAPYYANNIFDALKGYPSTDLEICDAVIKFYYHSKKRMGLNLSGILKLLSHYPSTQAKTFAFQILKKNSRYAAVHAARALLRMGVPPRQITSIALPLFKAADPNISEASFSILAIKSLPAAHLPKAAEVLNIMVETLSKKHNSNIIYTLPSLAHNTGVYSHPDIICGLLEHEATAVREGMTRLILTAFSIKDIDIRPFVHEKMLKRYMSLANDDNNEVSKNAVNLIGIISSGKRKTTYISPLLDIYKHKNKGKSPVKLEILKAINSILAVVAYQPQIEPVYLEALTYKNPRYRVEALKGLRFSPDVNFKKTLLVYKNDPAEDVREQVEQLFNLPGKTLIFRNKKENGWWDIITKFPGKN
jgi:hypothetical protein